MIKDTKNVIHMTLIELKSYLENLNDLERGQAIGGNSKLAGISKLELYSMAIQHDIEIYNLLNSFGSRGGHILYGFAWSKHQAANMRIELEKQSEVFTELQLSDVVNHNFDPPTSFRSNDFLVTFQSIVDTYGIASYKEINPAPFYAVTFPFLFGVMYGDVGHGFILFSLGIILILLADKDFMKKSDMKTIRNL